MPGVGTAAAASRLCVLTWCFVADFLIVDHRASGVRYYHSSERWWRPWTRWDSAHFLSIAEEGYTRKSDIAFLPGYPLAISVLGKLCQCNLVFAGLVISNVSFVLAAKGLERVAGNAAAVALVLSPASVFFSSVYSESLFAAFTFWGIALSAQRPWLASLLFAGATACRANGVLAAAFVIDTHLFSVVKVFVVVAPMLFHEAMSHRRFYVRSWSAYSETQREFWDVGFARYWQLKQIPNFILAAPSLLLTTRGIYILWKKKILPRRLRLRATFHAVASLALLVFVSHVEISTRLLASSSIPFHVALATHKRNSLVKIYVVLFCVAGTAAHVNFYPWT